MAKKKPVGLNAATPGKTKTSEKQIKLEKNKTPKVDKDGLSKNGTKSMEGKQGGFSGGGRGGMFRPGSPRGRGGFRGGRGRGFHQGPRQVDPKGVFCSFDESINANAAKAILKLAADAKSVCFGRGVVMYFETEEKAREIGMKAATMDFCGVKPSTVSKAYARTPPMKRELPDNADTAVNKKPKVESTVTQEVQDDEEDSDEDEDDEDDDDEDDDDEDDDDDDDDDDDEDDDDEDEDDDDEDDDDE